MNAINIRFDNNTIEITKKFAESASMYGSKNYAALNEARRDNPGFKVIITASKSKPKKDSFKGLTYEYMEAYITKHDDEQKTQMKEYKRRRCLLDAGENLPAPLPYGKMKKWFLEQYTELADFYKDA